MTYSVRFICNLFVLLIAASPSAALAQIDFAKQVQPILADNCLSCHGFDEEHREADVRLDTFDGATGQDGSTPAIVPHEPDQSELLARIQSDDDDLRMPPTDSGKTLTAEEIDILRQWIAEGANYTKHWAFIAPQKITPPQLPEVQHPIDQFVQAKLQDAGLAASTIAAPATLMRRVSLDLIGLPPTPDEIDQFEADYAQDPNSAYLDLVNRLLDSPHYGERWGRWWLDQARYADSNGYSIDAPREIWPYRDWVIQALNADMPFDRFTVEQLAGDLLPNATLDQTVATGFHRNTQINQEGGIDPEQFRIDSVFDRVATTGMVWFGLTVGCAQCHDHKFDPISQREFYQLFAFFNNQDEPSIKVYANDIDVDALQDEQRQLQHELSEQIDAQQAEFAQWEAALTAENRQAFDRATRRVLDISPDKRNPDQRRQLFAKFTSDALLQKKLDRVQQIQRILNDAPSTMVLKERLEARTSHVLVKGDFTRPSDEVLPGTLSVLHPFAADPAQANRLDLAQWIVSDQNPLTSRVIVNRIWQQYFGKGFVETENDFGLQGSSPTHPELLDWLAVEFRERGWSLKALHRLIVTSHTYRQSSIDRPELQQHDPQNYLLGRQQRLRLDAEVVRDTALTISGLLSQKLGGPPVYPPIPDGVMNQGQVSRSWKASEGEDRYRRGLYTFVYRATPPPSLNVFDAPDGFNSCTRRIRSNTPLQALTLMNDPAFVEFATSLQKMVEEKGIEYAFRRCTARRPSEDELSVLDELDSLTVARILLNLDETITRE
ncbi:MAG: PSD1 domain-containing protein [Planctomycetales bacterium]|nr:PSD1 domain-containing protein [Planctomycetales bacterium]